MLMYVWEICVCLVCFKLYTLRKYFAGAALLIASCLMGTHARWLNCRVVLAVDCG